MRDIPPADHPIELFGGALALDFANTIGGSHVWPSHDHLQGYGDMVDFAVLAGSLRPDVAKRLVTRAGHEPTRASAVFELGIALREAIWAVFSALASGEAPREADLALIGDAAAAGAARSRLVYDRDGVGWSLPSDSADLERPLWAIARSAAELLTSADRERVKECASETCEWVFLDRSRNHSRRWCDMSDCGNRAKARRFQERRRAAGGKGHARRTRAEAPS
ncbi:MAG TPA: ABATE domain-containing protein [Candidatus Limnocylindria bacterium]|jgi:predicted RNA-binding Zn ribbon-like protein|nr:ABATE domain-containing protein [Candidatus Limnocylindria bacterium]